jgi:hypothetical protein
MLLLRLVRQALTSFCDDELLIDVDEYSGEIDYKLTRTDSAGTSLAIPLTDQSQVVSIVTDFAHFYRQTPDPVEWLQTKNALVGGLVIFEGQTPRQWVCRNHDLWAKLAQVCEPFELPQFEKVGV